MKGRKTENQTILTDSVLELIKLFKADPKMVKNRIDSLIEREYLERADNDRTTLVYKP
jgi:DNA-binding MarR family transcriptional regulator